MQGIKAYFTQQILYFLLKERSLVFNISAAINPFYFWIFIEVFKLDMIFLSYLIPNLFYTMLGSPANCACIIVAQFPIIIKILIIICFCNFKKFCMNPISRPGLFIFNKTSWIITNSFTNPLCSMGDNRIYILAPKDLFVVLFYI